MYWDYQIKTENKEENAKIRSFLTNNGYSGCEDRLWHENFYPYITINAESKEISGNEDYAKEFGPLVTFEEFKKKMNAFNVGDKVTVKFTNFEGKGVIFAKGDYPMDYYVKLNRVFSVDGSKLSTDVLLFSQHFISIIPTAESFKLAGHEATTDGNSLTVGSMTLTFEQVEFTYKKMTKLKNQNTV